MTLTMTTGGHNFKNSVSCVIIWQGLPFGAGILHKRKIRMKSSHEKKDLLLHVGHAICSLYIYITGKAMLHWNWGILKLHPPFLFCFTRSCSRSFRILKKYCELCSVSASLHIIGASSAKRKSSITLSLIYLLVLPTTGNY